MPSAHLEELRRAELTQRLLGDLARISRIETLRAAWRVASDDEDRVILAYDDGHATLAEVEAAHARMNAAWSAYQAALAEAAAELAARGRSR